MESYNDERALALVASPVAVIYVSVEGPQPEEPRHARGPAELLHKAAVCLHLIADHVDELKRSLEQKRL